MGGDDRCRRIAPRRRKRAGRRGWPWLCTRFMHRPGLCGLAAERTPQWRLIQTALLSEGQMTLAMTIPVRLASTRPPFGLTDLFKIGIGPSSSHTVGPMRAGATFVRGLEPNIRSVARIVATLHGSLAWTGRGHGTDRATLLGLAGQWPDTVDPDAVEGIAATINERKRLSLPGGHSIAFDPESDLVFDFGPPPSRHPNGLTFTATDAAGAIVSRETWYSVGGGFIEREGEDRSATIEVPVPHRYATAADILAIARSTGLSLAEIALSNEAASRPESETLAFLDRIIAIMMDCMDRGLARDGILPGGLNVRRRAAAMYRRLSAGDRRNLRLPHETMDYVSVFAMAVNEENAAGGRIVTAPTNGASGVVPAVLRYYRDLCAGDRAGLHTILLTGSIVGDLIKRNASISGAEVGCQGEVGSAAAMAAAGLCAALGGTPEQVVNAAEIGLEHHLGMTCDPIGGLVQVPCIERNGFGAIKAISAASLALHGDGSHMVSLDQVIETMRQTGLDMKAEYRETSRGGLAVNVPEC